MITLTVPITAGLQARLSSMGCSLSWRDNQPVCVPSDAAVESAIATWSLADAKNEAIALVDAIAKDLRDQVVAGTSPAEMATWTIKRQEALNYDGTDASAPTLAAEASSRSAPDRIVTTGDVVERVQAKATALLQIEAMIAGTAGRHGDAIRALTSHAAVAAYDWTTDWPL